MVYLLVAGNMNVRHLLILGGKSSHSTPGSQSQLFGLNMQIKLEKTLCLPSQNLFDLISCNYVHMIKH